MPERVTVFVLIDARCWPQAVAFDRYKARDLKNKMQDAGEDIRGWREFTVDASDLQEAVASTSEGSDPPAS